MMKKLPFGYFILIIDEFFFIHVFLFKYTLELQIELIISRIGLKVPNLSVLKHIFELRTDIMSF